MSKIVGQVGAKPRGPKQTSMGGAHKRNPKYPGVVNHAGGSHPAARRALSPKASQRAVSNTQRSSNTPSGRNYSTGLDQDQALNQSNAMDQDSSPMQPGEFDVGSFGA